MNDEKTVRAGEYVLGVLGPAERAAVERDAAADPELASEIAFWSERFMPLIETIEAEPPTDLFDRIKTAIAADADVPGTLTVRGGETGWERIGKGIERKILNRATNGRVTYLIRGEKGARLPPHEHDEEEELYVLEGDLTIGNLTLRAGDFHLARRGVHHPMATTANGCMILVNAAA
jgi:quercetin dioxygenase-like cupin family protein